MHRANLVVLLIVLLGIFAAPASPQSAPPTGNEPNGGSAAADDANNGDVDPAQDEEKDGEPVSMVSGAFDFSKTVMHIAGRGMDFDFTLNYRNNARGIHSPLGDRWTCNWFQKIVLECTYKDGVSPVPPPGDSNESPLGGSAGIARLAGSGGGALLGGPHGTSLIGYGGSTLDGDYTTEVENSHSAQGSQWKLKPPKIWQVAGMGIYYYDGTTRIDKLLPAVPNVISSTGDPIDKSFGPYWNSDTGSLWLVPGTFSMWRGGWDPSLPGSPENSDSFTIPHFFEMRDPDGTIWTFGVVNPFCKMPGKVVYQLSKVRDRHGNEIRLEYEFVKFGDPIVCNACSDPGVVTDPNDCLVPKLEGEYRLSKIIDTLGREIALNYSKKHTVKDIAFGSLDRLESITDVTGNRTVTFGHDSQGHRNLETITTPATPDFPNGKTTAFLYDLWPANPVNYDPQGHNITAIISPNQFAAGGMNGTPYLRNFYDGGYRVVRQLFGADSDPAVAGGSTGGYYNFLYEDHLGTDAGGMIVPAPIHRGWFDEYRRGLRIDRNGRAKLYLLDKDNFGRLVLDFTGALDPSALYGGKTIDDLIDLDWPVPNTYPNLESTKLNPKDPNLLVDPPLASNQKPDGDIFGGAYFLRRDYNKDSMVVAEYTPDSQTCFVYYQGLDVFQRANLIASVRISSGSSQFGLSLSDLVSLPSIPDEDRIVSVYAYEPAFNQVSHRFGALGFAGTAAPNDYKTESVFDYQEGDITDPASPIAKLAATWKIDLGQQDMLSNLAPWGITLSKIADRSNQGDKNGDGSTSQAFGNVILTETPVASALTLNGALSATPAFQLQNVQSVLRYNGFSLPIASVDPVGNLTELLYYPVSDSGGGGGSPPTVDGGGFLGEVRRPESVVERHFYDALGRPTAYVNGRGYATSAEFNALDQVVKLTDAGGYVTEYEYDANDNTIRVLVDNKTPVFDENQIPVGETAGAPAQILHEYIYDILDRLVEERHPLNGSEIAVTKHRYSREGVRVLTVFPEGNAVSQVFDELGRLFQSTAGGVSPLFVSLAANSGIADLPTIPVDDPSKLDIATSENFYVFSRHVKSKDPAGLPTTHQHDGFNRIVRTTDALGNYRLVELDDASQTLSEHSFDETGKLLARNEHDYDEIGRVYESRAALLAPAQDVGKLNPGDGWAASRAVFDEKGRVVRAVDDNKVWADRFYDGLDRLLSTVDVAGNATQFAYDANSNLIHMITVEKGPSDAEEIFESWSFHDGLNRPIAAVNNAGEATRVAYDSRGNPVFTSDAKSAILGLSLQSLEFDLSKPQHMGFPLLPINGHGNSVQAHFDLASRPVQVDRYLRLDGMGGNPIVGVLSTMTDFDRNGRVEERRDGNGNPTKFLYDRMNRLLRTDFADGSSSEVLVYDKRSLVTDRKDANGTWTHNSYDALGRLIEAAVASSPVGLGGTNRDSFSYDGLSRLQTATNWVGGAPSSQLLRQHDSLSRVVQETMLFDSGAPATWVASFDGVGNLLTCSYPGGRKIAQSFDELNRIQTISDQTAPIARYEYVGPGLRMERKLLGANEQLVASFGYDQVRRMTQSKSAAFGATIDLHQYDWDRASNKIARRGLLDPKFDREFSYDSLDRLTRSKGTNGGAGVSTGTVTAKGTAQPQVVPAVEYQLDMVGNRKSVSGSGKSGSYVPFLAGPARSADFKLNQYTKTPFDERAYDANGNLKSAKQASSPGKQLLFDFRDRLVEFTDAQGRKTRYDYDALGRRIRKVLDAGTPIEKEIRYIHRGERVIEEQDASGAKLATYVYGNDIDEVLTMRRDGVDFFYHADDLYNVVRVTDESGTVLESYDYGDYGKPTILGTGGVPIDSGKSAIGNPYMFQGRHFDAESGLYYFRARYLDPQAGRFISRDPIGIWGDGANLGNGATFAGNNPWSRRDPYGLFQKGSAPIGSGGGMGAPGGKTCSQAGSGGPSGGKVGAEGAPDWRTYSQAGSGGNDGMICGLPERLAKDHKCKTSTTAPRARDVGPPSRLSKEELRAFLKKLKKKLRSALAGLDRYRSKEEWEAYESLSEAIREIESLERKVDSGKVEAIQFTVDDTTVTILQLTTPNNTSIRFGVIDGPASTVFGGFDQLRPTMSPSTASLLDNFLARFEIPTPGASRLDQVLIALREALDNTPISNGILPRNTAPGDLLPLGYLKIDLGGFEIGFDSTGGAWIKTGLKLGPLEGGLKHDL